MIEHQFRVAISPRAAARTRTTCRGKFAQVYMDPRYREWLEGNELDPGMMALLTEHKPNIPATVRENDVEVEMEVIVQKPKATKRRRPAGDNDNHEKSVWDAMTKTKLWWADDEQIVSNRTWKRWAYPGEAEGYKITVRFLDAA